MRQDDISCLLAEDINVCTHYDSIHHECKDMVRECGMFNKHCVVNGRFCPQSVRSFCPIVAGFNAGTYKVPACVL